MQCTKENGQKNENTLKCFELKIEEKSDIKNCVQVFCRTLFEWHEERGSKQLEVKMQMRIRFKLNIFTTKRLKLNKGT